MGDDKGIVASMSGEKGASSPYSIFSSDNTGALITSVHIKRRKLQRVDNEDDEFSPNQEKNWLY